jgi:glycosyltransferase involved in cell wall biosynthesis
LRFLLLGTIEHRKGQLTLVEAVNHLPLDVLDRTEFLIVGRPHDAKVAAQVRAAAENSAHLHYRETVGHQDALTLIQETDVMLCMSSDETGPLILIEATALGKPILSTKVGVVGENLIADEDALFVEPGDAIALAGAIQRLVQDPPLLRKLATNSRSAYERYFGLERFGKEFLGVVEEAIQNESSLREEERRSRDDASASPTIHLSEKQGKELQNFACR